MGLGRVGVVIDGADGSRAGARTAVGQEFQGDHLHGPVHAGHAQRVVANGADGAYNVRAVAIAIHGIIVVVDEIPANQIVDAAVSVIVDAVFPAGVVQKDRRHRCGRWR